MSRVRAVALFAALSFTAVHSVSAQKPAQADSFTFAVVGHVRGDQEGGYNYLVDELVEQLRQLHPNLVFLTGDMIWGDYDRQQVRRSEIESEWAHLDSALARIGAPVYRVPGNHDINDPVTRDAFFQRYGRPPRIVDFGNTRFVLLNSTYIPEGDSLPPKRRPFIGGRQIDSLQLQFLKSALADRTAQHAFLFMHHVLWWDDSAAWWRTVHPTLVGKVNAVFAGDYGPMKFSHTRRDSIDYIQSAIEDFPSLRLLQRREDSRLLYQQFDNFLFVTVAGPRVRLEVKTLGPITGKKFTPERWRAIRDYSPTLRERIRPLVGTPKRAALVLGVLGATFLLGAGVALGIRKGLTSRLE